MRSSLLTLAALCALLCLQACTVNTPYRYTAVVPAARPLAWDGRTAPDGSLRVEGSIAKNTIGENFFPKLHDTALRVPETTVEGSAAIAVAPGIELGARLSYAAYAWTSDSASGTEPLPSQPSLWGVGPEIRGTIPLDKQKHFALGLSGNLMRYETPYAEWEKTGPGSPSGRALCSPSPTCTVDAMVTIDPTTLAPTHARYGLFAEKSESHWTVAFGVTPSYAFGKDNEWGHLFGTFGGHTGFKNDGFTDKATNGSTLETAGIVWIVGIGYGIQVQPVRLSGMIFQPLTGAGSYVNYGPGGYISLGVDLELWEGKEAKRARLREEEEKKTKPEAPYGPPPPPAAPPPTQPAPGTPAPPAPPPPSVSQPGVQYIYPAGYTPPPGQ